MTWTSHGTLTLGLGDDARVECLIGRSGPQLIITGTRFSVSLFPSNESERPVNAHGVAFARSLVEQAAAYLAEVERLHAEHADQTDHAEQVGQGKRAGSEAA